MRIIILGNAGAGKSTMARRLIGTKNIPCLSLDEIACEQTAERKSLDESLRLLSDFLSSNPDWVIEGCYSDLVEAALPHCTELRFLNPGVETCVAHCNSRPWQPTEFASVEQQQAMLSSLIEWVRNYETRLMSTVCSVIVRFTTSSPVPSGSTQALSRIQKANQALQPTCSFSYDI
jgi:adenylate kinase family enzyme